MNLKRFHPPLGILLVILGAGFVLAACSQQFQAIPVTALKGIYPAEPYMRIIMGIIGTVLLVAGFSLVKVLIQVIGFFGGGAVGLLLAQTYVPGVAWAPIVGFVIGAVLGIGIAMTATSIGVFIAGMLIGAGLAQQAWPFIEGHAAPWLGLVISAAAGGILTLWLFNFWIAALTAIIGAVLLGIALNLQPLFWIVLFLVGVLIQTLISRKQAEPPV